MNQEAFSFDKKDGNLEKQKIKIKKKEPLKVELKSFISCVNNNKRPVVSGREGRQALEVALNILDKINMNTIQTN